MFCEGSTTYQGVFEDLGVFVNGGRVDGHAVVLPHQVCLAVARLEVCVLTHVTDHEDSARQPTRLLDHAVCNNDDNGLLGGRSGIVLLSR